MRFLWLLFKHSWHRWMNVRKLKWTNAHGTPDGKSRGRKKNKKRGKKNTCWIRQKAKKKTDQRRRRIKAWTTTPGRRKDRILQLRKMLFNLWVRPGLVVFTLICVFIDFVFSFNLLSISPPSHPHSLFYAPKTFFTLRLLLSPKPQVSPSMCLPIQTHLSFLFCHFVAINPPCVALSLCFPTSPSVSVPKALTWAIVIPSDTGPAEAKRRTESRECMFPKLSHDW